MASNGEGVDVRGEVVDLLLQNIASDRYPSVTMMNLVEKLLTPDDVSAYAAILMDKVQTETYPSIAILRRLMARQMILKAHREIPWWVDNEPPSSLCWCR